MVGTKLPAKCSHKCVLITGASSRIGEALALAFSAGNDLILFGRNRERLDKVRAGCLRKGVVRVSVYLADIADMTDAKWLDLLAEVDLVIHASSMSSRTRDSQIAISDQGKIIMVDLVAPLHLFQSFAGLSSKDHPRDMIFITSFLADIRTPNRIVYGSMKLLQEQCLRNIERVSPNFHILSIVIGTLVPQDRDSVRASRLAQQVLHAYIARRRRIIFGIFGRIAIAMFYSQPLVYYFFSAFHRFLRKPKFF